MQHISGQVVSPLLFARRLPAAKENALRYTGTDTELDPKDNSLVKREIGMNAVELKSDR